MFKEISVPFDKAGNMCHSEWSKDEMRTFSAPIQDDLKFEVIYQNSSGIVKFISTISHTSYIMNNTEFQRIVPFMVKGILRGNFTFTKHSGKYYSLKYLND